MPCQSPREQDVEPQLAPDFELVVGYRRACCVDATDVPDDLDRNDGGAALMGDQHVVGDDADDQEIAPTLAWRSSLR